MILCNSQTFLHSPENSAKGIYELYSKVPQKAQPAPPSFPTISSRLLHDLMCQMQHIGQFVSDLQISRWGKHQIQEACKIRAASKQKRKKNYRVGSPQGWLLHPSLALQAFPILWSFLHLLYSLTEGKLSYFRVLYLDWTINWNIHVTNTSTSYFPKSWESLLPLVIEVKHVRR